MNDLISRQAVVEKIREFADKISEKALNRYDLFSEISLLRKTADFIESMPAANQWTPNSEGPPEDEQKVLVTRIYKTNKGDRRFVDTAEMCCGDWLCDSDEFLIDKKRVSKPIAWMPMPEPYTTQSNDSKALDALEEKVEE